MAAALALLFIGALGRAVDSQGLADEFFDALDDPSIGYHSNAPTDPVAQLSRRIAAGGSTLAFDQRTGYLPALLHALDIPIASQLAVFSKTSLQAAIISPQNPRAIYFNDTVAVAWPRGGFIEIAAHDPRQGVVFYMLPQQNAAVPLILRRNECLQCHHSYATLGVPGLLVRSVVTSSRGEAMPFLGNYVVDDRTPFEERWAGWFVTGPTGQARHLGNQMPPVTRDLDAQVVPAPTAAAAFGSALNGYLSSESNVLAHLVFDHQARMINLLTRTGFEVRLAAAERRDVAAVARRTARELVDALLFVDEAPLPPGLEATGPFADTFAARGPTTASGRSLRQFGLASRLMRYPCSFMIYSDAFDALPADARDAVYRRLWSVLSGDEAGARYARLSTDDRTAIVEILRETKNGLPEYFRRQE